jgi:predicted amidohydrolase YtcJ
VKSTPAVASVFFNGRLYTVDESLPWASAVAVGGGRFAAVGDDESVLALAGPGARRIDLEGRLVLPGLCDAHIHFYDWCLARRAVPLADCSSLEDMVARVGKWAARAGGRGWITGRGWNESVWSENVRPTRPDLDPVTGPDRPAIFWRSDMHCAVANSAALAVAGIGPDTADPDGGLIGRDEEGRPNGLLWELAINLVMAAMPEPSPQELVEAFEDGQAELHRMGITAIHDQRMKDQSEGPLALDAYQRLRREGRLKLRLNCNIAVHDLDHLAALGLRGGLGDDYLRLGHIKLFADGTMGSQTAWMLEAYEGRAPDERGLNVSPLAEMAAGIRRAAARGFPASVHAIGDRANREVLDLFEELARGGPQPHIPHRIEHVQIIHPDDRHRLAALNLTASVQPYHVVDDMATAERVLGRRAGRAYNFRTLAGAGTLLALGSDAPVVPPNPFHGIHAALFRCHPDQMDSGPWYGDECLTLPQAIYGYTMGAASAAGWQGTIGSISPGKRADMVVLDRDLFRLVEDGQVGRALGDAKAALTLFDGEVVYEGGN